MEQSKQPHATHTCAYSFHPANIVYGKLITEPEVLKDLEHFLYSHMGHDLRFADLDSFKEILQSKLEKSDCWGYRESPENCDDDYHPDVFVVWCDYHEHPEELQRTARGPGTTAVRSHHGSLAETGV